MSSTNQTLYGIQSTAGAIPVRNDKGLRIDCLWYVSFHGFANVFIPIPGEVSMQKVKVQRYISGKRPEYAQYESSDEESGDDDFVDRRAQRNFANRGAPDDYDGIFFFFLPNDVNNWTKFFNALKF